MNGIVIDYIHCICSLDARVRDLIARLTPEEKVYQMMNNTPAIPRLHIPEYNWWNEALYPFGFGLSYTTFGYSDIRVSKPKIGKGESVVVEVTLTNTGKVNFSVYLWLPVRRRV